MRVVWDNMELSELRRCGGVESKSREVKDHTQEQTMESTEFRETVGSWEVRGECSGMREASHDQGLGDKVTGVMREKSMHGMGCLRGRDTGVVVMI